tara:strand:+ start:33 stop:1244 length:1212 start_codon:yes stop_codon:yes gene_type:complete
MVFGSSNSSNIIQNASTAQLIPGRVISIDQSSTLSNGEITVEPMKVSGNQPGSLGIKATPLFPNIKSYPLVNETVYLLSFPSGDFANNPGNIKYYYLSSVKTWANNIHVNPTPAQQESIQGGNQNKSLKEIELGSPNISTEQNTSQFKPGTYFSEKSDIYPLYPFEGDVILEGRFGNSLRFGSTDIRYNDSNIPTPLNDWSNIPNNGDPITILRNGQNTSLTGSAQSLIVENINEDISSIYLTSTQQLPLLPSSTNEYFSYKEDAKPTTINQYQGSQIILNSGRLVFNTTKDHLMLSSQKSINLNALDSINIDTTGPIVLEGGQVLLGSREATESVLLGDSTVDLLQNLISDLSSLLKIMGAQIGNNGILLEPTATAARTIGNNLSTYQSQLDSLKSNIVKVE